MKAHKVDIKDNLTIRILKHLRECFLETSIHGPKYLIKNNGSITIFIFWLATCVIGLVFCVILLWIQWDVYRSQPTQTSIENTNVPIYEIRFPAVTVCNNNQVYLPRTRNITLQLLNKGFKNETIHEYYKHLSVFMTFRLVPHNFTDISNAIKSLGFNTDTLMYKLSQPCSKLIEQCIWFNGDCKKRIKKIKTQNGYCCSLNYYLSETDEYLKHQNQSKKSRIYYVSGAGNKFNLDLVINVEPETYLSGLRPFYGSEILIHDGYAYPEVSIMPIIASINRSVVTFIGAHTVETDENVRSIPLNLRGCSYDGEAILDATSVYSYETCVSECRVARIIDICNCVPFYYRYIGHVRYCDLDDISCLNRHQVVFYSTHNPNLEKSEYEVNDVGLDLEKCKCYPECNDITYQIQSQFYKFMPNASFYPNSYVNKKNTTSIDFANKISLFVSYQDLTLIQYRRDVRVTWNNLLASLGGIFGLCVGGSVISIAEFFYLFALYFFKKKTNSSLKKNEMKTIKSISQFKVQPLTQVQTTRLDKNISDMQPLNRHRFAPRLGFNYFD